MSWEVVLGSTRKNAIHDDLRWYLSIHKGGQDIVVYIPKHLAEELGCKLGDKIAIAKKETTDEIMYALVKHESGLALCRPGSRQKLDYFKLVKRISNSDALEIFGVTPEDQGVVFYPDHGLPYLLAGEALIFKTVAKKLNVINQRTSRTPELRRRES